MAQYTIYFSSVAGTSVTVEADSLDEALEASYDGLPAGLCAQCAGWGRGPGIDMSGDWEADETNYEVDGKSVSA